MPPVAPLPPRPQASYTAGVSGPVIPLRAWASVFALALAMVAGVALLWQLVDVVLLAFLGITLAAALQPWHTTLCGLGVPRATAILLIYLVVAAICAGLAVLVLPVLVEETGRLLATVPETYGSVLSALRESPSRAVRLVGGRLPPFEALPAFAGALAPESIRGIFGLTTGALGVVTWGITVLAFAFYWTLEVPRVERIVLSQVPVARRTEVLGAWRSIEAKLGAYFRAQGIAMLVVGVASGAGYLLIGLPNPLVLAILAGLCEGVPLVGPFLAAVPAILAATTVGAPAVLFTASWCIVVQVLESNVMVPRLMSHAVGVSPLVSLMALLAFGSIYGVLGVLLAIPLAAVVQVVLDRFVLDPEAGAADAADEPTFGRLGARTRALRQRVRQRLQTRDVRMGIDPDTPAHVADAVDQRLEEAIEGIATMIRRAQHADQETDAAGRTRILEALHEALERVEGAVGRVDAAAPPAEDATTPDDLPLDELANATSQAERAIEYAEAAVAPADTLQGSPASRVDRS
jgi:predicted PurR-regulated permease PerM